MTNTESFINITNRKSIQVKGINDIISYDCNKIVFSMDACNLIISGNDFYIKKFDVENKMAEISGTLSSLLFNEAQSNVGKSFFTSLFK